MDLAALRYAPSHEWAVTTKDGTVVVGITKHAVDLLTDVVFIDLPDVGDHTFQGQSFGEIESVKAVSDLYAPLDAEVVEINKKIADDPAGISADPYGKGWLLKIKPAPGAKLDHLLTLEQYEQQVAAEGH